MVLSGKRGRTKELKLVEFLNVTGVIYPWAAPRDILWAPRDDGGHARRDDGDRSLQPSIRCHCCAASTSCREFLSDAVQFDSR